MAANVAKREAAILALLTSKTAEEAARAAGVHPVTLCRWQQEPSFRERLEVARREQYETAIVSLRAGALEAVEKLREIVRDGDYPLAMRAAGMVLEIGVKLYDASVMEERLRRIEERIAQTPEGRG